MFIKILVLSTDFIEVCTKVMGSHYPKVPKEPLGTLVGISPLEKSTVVLGLLEIKDLYLGYNSKYYNSTTLSSVTTYRVVTNTLVTSRPFPLPLSYDCFLTSRYLH